MHAVAHPARSGQARSYELPPVAWKEPAASENAAAFSKRARRARERSHSPNVNVGPDTGLDAVEDLVFPTPILATVEDHEVT